MIGTLYVPYSYGDPNDGFVTNKEYTKEQYAKLMIDTYKKYKDGIDEGMVRDFTHNLARNYHEKEKTNYKQQDYYYDKVKCTVNNMGNQSMSIDELIHYYQTGEPFICIISVFDLKDNPDLESDMKNWMNECMKINRSPLLTPEEKITGLSKKSLKVKFDKSNSSAILRNCKMVDAYAKTKYAFLVEEIVFVTESESANNE